MKLKYIVTGTGRSGTVYMARFLTSVGVVCGHECIFNRFGLERAEYLLSHPTEVRTSLVSGDSWMPDEEIVADSSYMAAPYLGSSILCATDVIHAVRHPLRVISSFVNDLGYFKGTRFSTQYERFIYSTIPELYEDISPAERACVFYVRWNEMIARSREIQGRRYLRFRVEDDPTELVHFLDNCRLDPAAFFRDRKANTMNTKKFVIRLKDIPEGLPKRELVGMAEDYGYDPDLKIKVF